MDDSKPTTPSEVGELLDLLRERLVPASVLLTRDKFAELLAVGTSTFDRLRERGKIGPKPIRLAGLKWHRDEVLAWLQQRDRSAELYDVGTWPKVWERIQKQSSE